MRQKISHHRRGGAGVPLSLLLTALFLLGGCSAHDNKVGRFVLLDAERDVQRNQKAVDNFRSSVRPRSSLSEAHYRLGRHYQQQGRYNQAIEEFGKALNVEAGMCRAYNGIAMSYDALRQCDLAQKAYEQALQCAPEETYVYNNYGYSSILCNKLAEGTALLLKAEELSGDSERIRNNLEFAQLVVTRKPAANSDMLPADASSLDLASATPRELAVHLAGAAQKQEERQTARARFALEGEESEAMVREVEQVEQPSVVYVPSVGANFQPHLLVDDFESSSGEVVLPAQTSVAAVNTGHGIKPVLKPAVMKKRAVAGENGSTTAEAGEDGHVDPLFPVTGSESVARSEELPQALDKPDAVKPRPQEEEEAGDSSQVWYRRADTGVEVSNGNGVAGMARRSSELLGGYGFKVRRITNASHFQFDQSVIYFRDGYLPVARELSHFLPGDPKLQQVDSLERAAIGVRVLLGNDLVALDFPDHYTQLSYMQLEQGKPGGWKDLVTLHADD